MKKFGRKLGGAFFDLKVIVATSGILLSIAAHELFHIIIHWGEIESMHLFPDRAAIFEIIFTPSTTYDLVLEEGIAYTITIVTLILTAMLIGDIHDARDTKNTHQTIFGKDLREVYPGSDEQLALEHLARLLGIEPAR